jgi:hypothetical protein
MLYKNLSIFKALLILPPIALAGSPDSSAPQPQRETGANRSVMTIQLNTADQIIIIKGDSNLVPENIRVGVTIFGVTGSFSGVDTITQIPALPSSPQALATSSNRYTDNGNGTIIDNRTRLIWLKEANCFGEQDWETAMQSARQLADGQCGLIDGSRQGMWRLPTKLEWKAMIDNSYTFPTLSNSVGTGIWTEGDAFTGVQTNFYWSSSTHPENKFGAWHVNLGLGQVYEDHRSLKKAVWAVRGR